jgi:para-aminobenzoate synthetase/4-amino-4-deoxychorismate lyase
MVRYGMSTGRASFGLDTTVGPWSVELADPVAVRQADVLDDVLGTVEWVDDQAHRGRWGVLLLAYESAPAFDTALRVREADGPMPLAWAAAYAQGHPRRDDVDAEAGAWSAVGPWTPAIGEARFASDIEQVLAHIAAGDTYQVNYTFPVEAPFAADPWRWYRETAAHAAVPYPACVDLGDAVVMSLSPELFLERRGSRLTARPMKGTARRGRWLGEDERLSRALAGDAKARAENVMIVDLLRNDVGRLAEIGSVQVRELCRLERYPTVWQLTSTIEARLRTDVTLRDLLTATFPCGSVTGAPKVSTMGIIAALEAAPRGLYTGAIVLLRPGGDFVASVPIRTVVLDRRAGRAVFGVGAGITADSVAADEWAECLAKARVVRPPAVPDEAELFETLRLERGVCVRAEAHLARLRDSARLFGWAVDEAASREALLALGRAHPEGTWRARLFLTRDGAMRVEAVPFDPSPQVWRVGLAREPIDPRSPLVFNKTTCRAAYDDALATVAGVDDVLLWNARGEVTETTRASLIAVIDGIAMTPPLACGLLPGVMRGELLTRGDVEERVLRIDDLRRASEIWLVNSLRGRIDVTLV